MKQLFAIVRGLLYRRRVDADEQHEADMAAEEALGPVKRATAVGIRALTDRIQYLQGELSQCTDPDEAERLAADLAKARQQLADYEAQHRGRN